MADNLERYIKITADATQAANELKKLTKIGEETQKGFADMAATAKRAATVMATAFAGVQSLRAIVTSTEQIEDLQGSFVALLGSGEAAADMMKRVFAISSATGADLKGTGETVQRLAIGLKELGATNESIGNITENFIKLGRIGGTSINDITGAAVQLGQALSSGTLQGDELRSILERVPLVAQLIAKEMNVTVGELKKLGAEGKITSGILANALLKAGTDINKKFAELPKTVTQSMNILQGEWTKFLAAVGKSSDIFKLAETSVKYISSGLKEAGNSASTMGILAGALKTAFQTVAVLGSDLAFIFRAIASDAQRLLLVFGAALSGDFAAIPKIWKEIRLEQEGARKELDAFQAAMLGTGPAVGSVASAAVTAGSAMQTFSTAGSKGVKEVKAKLKEVKEELSAIQEIALEISKIGRDRSNALEQFKWLSDSSVQAAMRQYGVSMEDIVKVMDRLREAAGGADPLAGFKESIKASVLDAGLLSNKLLALEAAMQVLLEAGESGGPAFAELARQWAALKTSAESTSPAISQTAEAMKGIGGTITTTFGSAIDSWVQNMGKAKTNFREMTASILKDIAAMLLKLAALNSLKLAAKSFGLDIFANGGQFAGGTRGLPRNAVIDSPHLFKFANGASFRNIGIAGEAGPEAIMPLKRNAQGQLGVVDNTTKGSNLVVNVNNTNASDTEVRIAETQQQDGSRVLDILIERKMKSLVGSGSMDAILKANYGVRRAAM